MKRLYKPLSDEQKRNLGILIKYHRRKLHMTQEHFVRSGICSRATFSALENGKMIKQDMVYYEILAAMGKTYVPEEDWEREYAVMADDLLVVFMYMEEKAIEKMQKSIIQMFSRKTAMFYYEQQYTSTCCILQYAKIHKSNLSHETYEEIMATLDMYPESMRILLLHLCFLYCYSQMEDIAEIEKHMPIYSKYADHVLLKMDLYMYQQEKGDFDACRSLKKTIEDILSDNVYRNHYYLFQSQIALSKSRMFLKKQTEVYTRFYKQVMDGRMKLNQTIKRHVLRNMVTFFYNEFRDYENAYQILQYIKEQDPQSYGTWYEVVYIVCAERIGEKVTVSPVLRSHDTIYLYYFHMKYNEKAGIDDLLDYIMHVILPVVKQHKASQMVEIFKEEIEALLLKGESKRYKDYFTFLTETKI